MPSRSRVLASRTAKTEGALLLPSEDGHLPCGDTVRDLRVVGKRGQRFRPGFLGKPAQLDGRVPTHGC